MARAAEVEESRRTMIFVLAEEGAGEGVVEAIEAGGWEAARFEEAAAARAAMRQTPAGALVVWSEGAAETRPEVYAALRQAGEPAYVPVVAAAHRVTVEEEARALAAGADAAAALEGGGVLLRARLGSLLRTKARHDGLAASNARLEQLSHIDPGTGMYNRRHLFERLEEEFARVRRRGDPLAMVLLDVDDFKRVNDTHGHVFGDFVLARLAAVLQKVGRRGDVVARYGGEEFAYILPGATLDAALQLAERARSTVADTVFASGGVEERITVSLGAAEAALCEAATPDELLACADKALYAAKSGGRDRIVAWEAGRGVEARRGGGQA